MTSKGSIYRLVGLDGHPHPVLDTPFESMDAAVVAARKWTSRCESNTPNEKNSIGVEVMTSNGSWRTILYS